MGKVFFTQKINYKKKIKMDVIKRDGRKEPIMFDKITARVRKLCYGLNEIVDPVKVAMRVIEGLYDGVTTSELDNLAAETAATLTTSHPFWFFFIINF